MTHPGKCFKAAVMTLDCFHPVGTSVTSVAVHFKGDMLWHRALLQGTDEELTQLVNGPFSGRRFEDQSAQ